MTAAGSVDTTYSPSSHTVTLTASVTATAVVNAGSVTFSVRGTVTRMIGTPTDAPVVNGSADVSYGLPAQLTAGTYEIVATFSGTTSLQGSSDSSHTLTVAKLSTTTTMSTQDENITYGYAAEFRATVSSAVAAAGTVQFAVTGVNLGPPSPLTNGSAVSAQDPTLLPGAYRVTATYSGDPDLSGSVGVLTPVKVGKADVTVTVPHVTVTYSPQAQDVDLSATISPGYLEPILVNQGNVEFQVFVGTAPVGTAVTGPVSNDLATVHYKLPAGLPAEGAYRIRATYSGGAYFTAATSGALIDLSVDQAASVLSATSAPTTYGQPVIVTVTASGDPTGSVRFSVTGFTSGVSVPLVHSMATSPPFTYLSVGRHTVHINYAGDGNYLNSSLNFDITVSRFPQGYDLVGSDGGVFVFDAPGQAGGFFGSLPGDQVTPATPVVGMVPTVNDQGYFLVAGDGGVFSFGNAPYLGSLPGLNVKPAAPITGLVAADTDQGYFLVGRDGGVFAFGNVPYLGSLPGSGIHVDNIVGIAATPTGFGYWLVSSTGTVYAFGTASADGPYTTTGKTNTTSPVAAIAGTPTGQGFWVVTQAGGVISAAVARNFGGLPALGITPAHPIVGIVQQEGAGYLLLGADGGIFSFGTAPFYGSLPELGLSVSNIVGAVPN